MLNKKQTIKEKQFTCGTCLFRDYGTDSHYVCKVGDCWFRVNQNYSACCHYMKKRKYVK